MRRLACSNQTLLFSRRRCEVHQKQPSNTRIIPSCQRIWVRVLASCQIRRGKCWGDSVLFALTDPVNPVWFTSMDTRASATDLLPQVFNIELTRKRDHAVTRSEIWDSASSGSIKIRGGKFHFSLLFLVHKEKNPLCSKSTANSLLLGQKCPIRRTRFWRFSALAAVSRKLWSIKWWNKNS